MPNQTIHIEIVKTELEQLKEICEEQRKEIEALKDFKKKIELGSYLIRCTAYTLGAIAVFIVSLFPYLEKWFYKY